MSQSERKIVDSSTLSGAGQRDWDRSPIVVTTEVIVKHEIYVSLSQNISGGGMFLSLPFAPPLGEVIQLHFPLGGVTDIIIESQVIWTMAQPGGFRSLKALPHGVGVKFINLSEEDRASIVSYVTSMMPPPTPIHTKPPRQVGGMSLPPRQVGGMSLPIKPPKI